MKRKADTEVQKESPKKVKTTEYPVNDHFLAALVHTSCEKLKLSGNTVFTADRDDKVVDVFSGLNKHHFLSVPVLTATEHKYYGFIHVADIVDYFAESLGEKKLATGKDFWEVIKVEEEFKKKTVNDLMEYPRKNSNPFHPVKVGYSLFYVMEALAKEKHLHRVAVIDDDRNLVTLITQSRLVEFLWKNIDLIGERVNKPVGDLKNCFHEVVSVTKKDLPIKAFKRMSARDISGVAVVEGDRVVDAISLRDLKVISSDGSLFWRLYKPMGEFLKVLDTAYDAKHKRARKVQTVTSTDTLRTVIKHLAETGLHHLFIVDSHKKAQGIISLKDVLLDIIS